MADTITAKYGLTKVEVGSSLDTWGAKLNTNFDLIAAIPRTLESGTAAAPSLAFASDPAMGVYRSGSSAMGFSVGGSARATLSTTLLTLAAGVNMAVPDGFEVRVGGATTKVVFNEGVLSLAVAPGAPKAFYHLGNLVGAGAGDVSYGIDGNSGAAFASGTDGTSFYEKRASGILECWGSVTITPVPNVPTALQVNFPVGFFSTTGLNVQATAISSVPGTTVLGASANNKTANNVDIVVTRTNGTNVIVDWCAKGRWRA